MQPTLTKRHLVAAAMCVAFACVLSAGCTGRRDAYAPVGPRNVAANGWPEANYKLPGGRVVVMALPVRGHAPGDEGAKLVGVRMFVANEGERQPWFVDVDKQVVRFDDRAESTGPALVKNRPGTGVVEIPAGENESIDLYFPAPPAPESSALPGQLVFEWKIQAGEETIAHSSRLLKVAIEPVVRLNTDNGEGMGRLWYDPDWNSPVPFRPWYVVQRWRVIRP
jgi:hypothetical protein